MNARRLAAAIVAIVTLGGALAAQTFGGRSFGGQPAGGDDREIIDNPPYDGRLAFARIRYTTAPGGYYYQGRPAWAHGYPRAERDLMKIVAEVSDVSALNLDRSEVIALDDPALFNYPVAYMTEAGFWVMNDKEATALRAYLEKGGFLILDDFRDNFRGGGGWANFAANMKRVLPERRIVDLDVKSPVFQSFFEIGSFDIVRQFYDRDRPSFRGIFEDDDPTKRLMVMINFNTDVANYWEFSATGATPVSESNEAYKLGVNYLIYGMTH